MTWFKIDDSFWGHPKRMATPPAALGVWVTAGSWCAQQLTDGFIPHHVLPAFGGRPKDAADLVRSGLWEKVDGGWSFHDWNNWQPTKAQVYERRDAEAKRKQEWRDKKSAKQSCPENVPPGHPPDATRDMNVASGGTDADVPSTRPDPTRPVLSSTYVSRSKSPSVPRGSTTDDLTKTIIEEHRRLHGYPCSPAHAQAIAADVLTRAGDVRDPAAYVRRAMTNDRARHREHTGPPRLVDLCDHGLDGHACPHCRTEARSA